MNASSGVLLVVLGVVLRGFCKLNVVEFSAFNGRGKSGGFCLCSQAGLRFFRCGAFGEKASATFGAKTVASLGEVAEIRHLKTNGQVGFRCNKAPFKPLQLALVDANKFVFA